MKRLVYLVAVVLVTMLILVPSALAQGTTAGKAEVKQKVETTTEAPLPKSGGPGLGGPAVVLPAAGALLLGSGVLAYAVLRRR
jgi:inner membrane protein involved in colicin E2 resistance